MKKVNGTDNIYEHDGDFYYKTEIGTIHGAYDSRAIAELALETYCTDYLNPTVVTIDGQEATTQGNYLDAVTYVPEHAEGNAQHKDAQRGVIISVTSFGVRVLYCNTRAVQLTKAENLVWG